MKIRSYKLLFRIFSYLSDKTNGASIFVKYKLMIGTLIIGLTGSVANAKAQKKDSSNADNDSIIRLRSQVTCYKIYVPPKEPQRGEMEITGNVKDILDKNIIGVSIRIKERPKVVTNTNIDGNFKLNVRKKETLVFSYEGLKKKEVPVSDFEDNVTIVLEEQALGEVVVVAKKIDKSTIIGCYAVQTIDESLINPQESDVTSKIYGDIIKEIKGTVLEKSGEPLLGLTVVVKGTTNGTVTDPGGNFSLKVKAKDVLEFSYIGFKRREIPVSQLNVSNNRIVMEEEEMILCYEVVVMRVPSGDDIYRRRPEKITKLPYNEAQTPPVSRVGYLPEFEKWVNSKVRYNDEMRDDKIEGTIEASFSIDKKGSVKDVKLTKKLHPYADAEVLRVIDALGKWTPGENNGKKIKTTMIINVKFVLETPPTSP